jgi:hypothetical protein
MRLRLELSFLLYVRQRALEMARPRAALVRSETDLRSGAGACQLPLAHFR